MHLLHLRAGMDTLRHQLVPLVSKRREVDLLFSSSCEPARYWSRAPPRTEQRYGCDGSPNGISPRMRKERYNVAEEFIPEKSVRSSTHKCIPTSFSYSRGLEYTLVS